MSQVFFDELDIPRPDVNLSIGGTHGQNPGRMLEAIEAVLLAERPDWVLVYGDTDSTLAGALAAVKLHIPVLYVEAGLRSFDRRMPEEINRVLTDHAFDLLFVPTETAVANLKREGLPKERIALVGDVMYGATLFYAERANARSRSVEYLDMVMLERLVWLIATDSGGDQKEAFFYCVPCVTLHTETEWGELLETGWNVLAPPTSAVAIRKRILESLDRHNTKDDVFLYGDDRASEYIALSLEKKG